MNKYYLGATACVLAVSMTSTVLAAGWRTGAESNQNRWWYETDDSYVQSEWRWIDGNQDGIAECYAFDEEGWMYVNTVTPDGFQVNEDGAWVEDGIVRTQTAQMAAAAHQDGTGSRILVVYYSMPESDGTDTDSGASRVAVNGQVQGNVEYVANIISETSGGEIFRINTVQRYPGDHQTLVNQASAEQDQNARPALESHIADQDNYDVIFIGYPNWWGDMPMPLYTFFDEHDFSGKKIIPFTCHGGSGFADTISSIARLEPNANVLNGYSVARQNAAGDGQNIRNWVSSLNLGN